MGLFAYLFGRKKTFSMQPTDLKMWSASRVSGIEPTCDCLKPQYGETTFGELSLHSEIQDTNCEAWMMLEDLIEVAAENGSHEFAPNLQMPPELWSQIITLPASIAKLVSVRKLYLYGSHLVHVPPEIGEMASLEELDLYTSYRLHWMPFEVTRCLKLKSSRVSTRALYGNYKYRPPFPRLPGQEIKTRVSSQKCSVCRQASDAAPMLQVWISLLVGTDILPLLVNACSHECISRLPPPAHGYVKHPHTGGLDLIQPPPERLPPRS